MSHLSLQISAFTKVIQVIQVRERVTAIAPSARHPISFR